LTDQNTQKYKAKILEAHLIIERLKLSNECTIRIDTGLSTILFSDFCNKNELPKFIMCGFVKENSFSGRSHLNPFHFIPNKVKSINLTKNGTSITGKRLTMDYGGGYFSEAYHQFVKSLGFLDNLDPCSITPNNYLNGTTVYGFDLAPTCNGLNYVDQIRQGNMEIEIVFDGDTTEKTKFIIISIYDSRISINSLMRIDKNYTS
jgi:hypothetical protein